MLTLEQAVPAAMAFRERSPPLPFSLPLLLQCEHPDDLGADS
jgi:hypothetical protein